MTRVQFAASLVDSLAWPVVVGVVILVVWFSAPRPERAGFLGRLRKAGPSGIELDKAGADLTAATGLTLARVDRPNDGGLPYDDATREGIDLIIEAAAKWGWVRAGGAAVDFPKPLIAWTPHGATIVQRYGIVTADTVTFAAGSFTDAHTGKPNTTAYTRRDSADNPPPIEEPQR